MASAEDRQERAEEVKLSHAIITLISALIAFLVNPIQITLALSIGAVTAVIGLSILAWLDGSK
jgi:hypothetical protein